MFKVLQLQVYLRVYVRRFQISLLTDHVQIHSDPKSIVVSPLWLFFLHDLHVLKGSLRHCIWILRVVLVEGQNRWGLKFVLEFCTSWDRPRMMIIRWRHSSSINQVYFTSEVFNDNRAHRHPRTSNSSFRVHPIVEGNKFFCIRRNHYCTDTAPTDPTISWVLHMSSLMILTTDSHISLSPLLIRVSRQAFKVPRVDFILWFLYICAV